jgi:hypothetical protein
MKMIEVFFISDRIYYHQELFIGSRERMKRYARGEGEIGGRSRVPGR